MTITMEQLNLGEETSGIIRLMRYLKVSVMCPKIISYFLQLYETISDSAIRPFHKKKSRKLLKSRTFITIFWRCQKGMIRKRVSEAFPYQEDKSSVYRLPAL